MARPRKTAPENGTVVGYIRVSTDEQAESGLGLAAQRSAIEAEVERRGWTLLALRKDAGLSGKTMDRPGLAAALEAVETGTASTLMVAKLDRLSRSLVDFAALMARAQAAHWNLVALDLGVDLSTPAGEFLANVMASAAQWERRVISQRTRDALAAKRAEGVRLGRPVTMAPEVVERITTMRRAGAGWSAIARDLNDADVPTTNGGLQWWPSTVRAAALLHETETL